MKVIILAGGRGTRLGATQKLPKPMHTVGDRPLLWHIAKHFENYDIGAIVAIGRQRESFPAELPCFDTGADTATGGRVLRLRKWVDETFFVTYGDGVADIDLHDLLAHHVDAGAFATMTCVHPPSRFGEVEFTSDGRVKHFLEKPRRWINGGYLVLGPQIWGYLDDDETVLETALERVARAGQLAAYKHHGFWQCCDTPRDLATLRALWNAGDAPWRVW